MRLYKLIFKRKKYRCEVWVVWSTEKSGGAAVLGGHGGQLPFWALHSSLVLPQQLPALCPLMTLVDNFSVRVYPNVTGHFINRWVSGGWIEVKEGDWIAVKSLLLLTETHTHTHNTEATESAQMTVHIRLGGFGTNMVWNDPPGLRISCSPKPNFPLIF